MIRIGTQDGFQPIGFPKQFGHGAGVLPDILGVLTLALLIEELRQVLSQPKRHLQAPQGAVKPAQGKEQGQVKDMDYPPSAKRGNRASPAVLGSTRSSSGELGYLVTQQITENQVFERK